VAFELKCTEPSWEARSQAIALFSGVPRVNLRRQDEHGTGQVQSAGKQGCRAEIHPLLHFPLAREKRLATLVAYTKTMAGTRQSAVSFQRRASVTDRISQEP
jgi:hypothetical protein